MKLDRILFATALLGAALSGCLATPSNESEAARQTEPGWVAVVLPWDVATGILQGGPVQTGLFVPHDGTAVADEDVAVILAEAVQQRILVGVVSASDRIALFQALIRATGATLPNPGRSPCAPPDAAADDPRASWWGCEEGQAALQARGDEMLWSHLRAAGYSDAEIEAAVAATRA